MLTVTEQLRREIDRSAMSRYEICKRSKVDQARMSRFMAGGKLTLDQVDRVCRVLGLHLTKKGR